ncbi:hypothetical protein JOQ06_020875, partial [Pogonophryne albipinna]
MIRLHASGGLCVPSQRLQASKSQPNTTQTKWDRWGTAFSICIKPGYQHYIFTLARGSVTDTYKTEVTGAASAHWYLANDQEIARQLSIAPLTFTSPFAMQLISDIWRAFPRTPPSYSAHYQAQPSPLSTPTLD